MARKDAIRFGILGAARIAPAALIKPAAEMPDDVRVVAIAARDLDRAREFAAQHGISRVHESYAALLDDPDIDVVYNPLPNSLHCEWTIRALRAGKHVLCEKPIASNASEAERMAGVARETGRTLAEAFHYRYHPLAARVRDLISAGTLGRLTSLEGNFTVPIPQPNIRFDWNLAGGATMDLGCYPLHMLREFSGLEPKVMRAKAVTGPENIDVTMEVDLEMSGGVKARMICSMAPDVHINASFVARGDSGELSVLNPVAPHIGNQLTLKTAAGEKQESIAGDSSYTCQLRAFVAALNGGPRFPTDGDAAIANMRLIDDVYRAAGLPIRGT